VRINSRSVGEKTWDKRDILYFGGEGRRRSIILLKGSEASPTRASDRGGMKL
jgi:hypothetical protein